MAIYLPFNSIVYCSRFAQILRPGDLKNLCLTSKHIREIVTPQLYRKVLLFIGGHKDVRVSGLLSQSNPGIQHIRKVYLQLEKTFVPPPLVIEEDSDESSEGEGELLVEDISGSARQAQFTVRLLLDFLPNDILETFRYVFVQLQYLDGVQCYGNRHLQILVVYRLNAFQLAELGAILHGQLDTAPKEAEKTQSN